MIYFKIFFLSLILTKPAQWIKTLYKEQPTFEKQFEVNYLPTGKQEISITLLDTTRFKIIQIKNWIAKSESNGVIKVLEVKKDTKSNKLLLWVNCQEGATNLDIKLKVFYRDITGKNKMQRNISYKLPISVSNKAKSSYPYLGY